MARLNQIQYRATKLCTGALHWTSQSKIESELGWESLYERGKFLGLSLFHKIHIHQTRPLVRSCLPPIAHHTGMTTRSDRAYANYKLYSEKFKKSFFPYHVHLWNNLDKKLKCEQNLEDFKCKLKSEIKPKKHRHFARGCKQGNKLHTRLRLGRSMLNSHRFEINLSDTDQCLCSRSETVKHYLTECFLYTEERRLLFSTVIKYIPSFSKLSDKKKTDLLLHGMFLDSNEPDSRNSIIFHAVQKFILKTKRC